MSNRTLEKYQRVKNMFTVVMGDCKHNSPAYYDYRHYQNYYGGANRRRNPALVFYRKEDPEKLTLSEEGLKLAKDPTVKALMGDGFVGYITTTHYDYERVLVFDSFFTDMLPVMDGTAPDKVYLVKWPGKDADLIKASDIVTGCKLPQSVAMTCTDCLEKSTKESRFDCLIKTSVFRAREQAENRYRQYYYSRSSIPTVLSPSEDNPRQPLEDILDELTNLKSTIGEYTYVSPSMTSEDPINGKIPLEYQAFEYIKRNVHMRQSNQVERYRFEKFVENDCNQCTIEKFCPVRWNYGARTCRGKVTTTWEEVTDSVLRNVDVPFNNRQIRYLLANTGEFTKRYRNRKIIGSLAVTGKTLLFQIMYKTTPEYGPIEAFTTFRDAKKFICKYGDDMPPISLAMTKKRKAMLLELASHEYSAPKYGGWGHRTYPKVAVYLDRESVTAQHSYNGRGYLWNNERFFNLESIYREYEGLNTASEFDRIESPYRKRD